MTDRTHGYLERTSPKGQPFRGECPYCGAGNLKMSQVNEPCDASLHSRQGGVVMISKGKLIDALESCEYALQALDSCMPEDADELLRKLKQESGGTR